MFRDANDQKLKQQLQDKLETIETNCDNPVAIAFALSGMMQMLSNSDSHTSTMSWRLIEAKKAVLGVIRVLRQYQVKAEKVQDHEKITYSLTLRESRITDPVIVAFVIKLFGDLGLRTPRSGLRPGLRTP